MSELSVLGIDLAKNVFQVHGVDRRGHKVLSKRVPRAKLLAFVANLPPCLVGLEACGGAHHWARRIGELGHQVRIMSAAYVKPYVKSQKNDYRDAEAICEAVTRPGMRFVPVKAVEQQDLQAHHRVRALLIKQRTATTNQIRGLLSEYGIILAKGRSHVRRCLPSLLEDGENGLSLPARALLNQLYTRLLSLNEDIDQIEKQLQHIAKHDERCQRLCAIPGVGYLIATAVVAAVDQAHPFTNGRQVAAWLGLVPRQHSSGDSIQLGKISKRGDRYLRTLLVHGARSVLYRAEHKTDRLSCWVTSIKQRRGFNKAAVALANKNARIIGALLLNHSEYQAA